VRLRLLPMQGGFQAHGQHGRGGRCDSLFCWNSYQDAEEEVDVTEAARWARLSGGSPLEEQSIAVPFSSNSTHAREVHCSAHQ
jgi:hypothetical protein